jgi:hypothetical protein
MRYSLSAFYRDYVKERILKDSFKNGKIPSPNEIEESLNLVIQNTNEFKNPLLSSTNYFVENGEISSAKKVNEVFKTIESDLSVCVSAIIDQEDKISSLYDTCYSKLIGLQKKVALVNQDVDKMLFESKNTDTHEEIFYEKFSSLDMINTTLSTASIDVNTNEVTLKSTEQYPIDLSSAADSITVVAENNPKIIGSTDIGNMVISNIVKSNNKVWMHQLSANEALASAVVDVIIRIPSVTTEINKILLEPHSVDLKTQVNVEIAFSKDGLNWIYPSGEYKKRLEKTTSLSFTGTTNEYWRIRFTKFGNDGFFSNFYVYNFGLKSINFYGKVYDKISRLDLGYLYSKPILFNNIVKVANVKVCEEVPLNTNITYKLAPIYQSQLAGIQNGSISPEDIFYYSLNLKDVDSATIDFLNTSKVPTINGIMINESLSYKDKGENDYCLDALLSVEYIKNQTTILRGALNQDLYSVTGKEKIMNSQYAGWNFDGNYYSTYVLIEDHDGQDIDLGSTQLYINNVKVQGKVKMAQGLNFVVTHRDNWKSLDLITLPVEADQLIDPLYPYNHKYLVEGFGDSLYGRSLTTIIDGKTLLDIVDKNGIYPKTPKSCWSMKMRELSFEAFASKTKNELDVFSYKIDNTNQERIVVKSNPDLGLINDETFSIITKLHSAENIKGLIFKAVLETANNKVSPILTEYMVKIK